MIWLKKSVYSNLRLESRRSQNNLMFDLYMYFLTFDPDAIENRYLAQVHGLSYFFLSLIGQKQPFVLRLYYPTQSTSKCDTLAVVQYKVLVSPVHQKMHAQLAGKFLLSETKII